MNPSQIFLPDGWRMARLGEVCEINPSRKDKTDFSDEMAVTFAPMSSVDDVTGTLVAPIEKKFGEVKKGYTWFVDGDVLWAKITPCMENGKAFIARDLMNGVGFGSTEFHVLRPRQEIISEYIWYFVRQESFRQLAAQYFTGAVGQQRVPESFLSEQEIPLPPLPEQRRIAARLNEIMVEVARARKAAQNALDAANAIPNALLRAVFESEEAKGWEKKSFGDLVKNFDGKRIPVKQEDRKNRRGIYPYYGASGIIDSIDDFIFDGEYLLIGEDGANLLLRSSPIAFKANGKFWVNNHAHVVQPRDNVLLDYLLHFLAVTDLSPLVTGAAQPKLTQEDLNSISVPLPTPIVQGQITKRMNEQMICNREITNAAQSQLAALNALPAAYLKKAFRGEL